MTATRRTGAVVRGLPEVPTWRLLAAIACAVALHASLLMALHPTKSLGVVRSPAVMIEVRMVPRQRAPLVASSLVEAVSAEPSVGPERELSRVLGGSSTPDRAVVSEPPSVAPTPSRQTELPVLTTPVISAPAVAVAPFLPPAPDYFGTGQLDPGPRPLDDIEPLYPKEAGLQEGVVVLRLLINPQGGVDDVAVVRSFPLGVFESSALAAFTSARFSPGMVLGLPVKSQITIEVMFTPINRGAKVSGRSY
jgi:TonB family protein